MKHRGAPSISNHIQLSPVNEAVGGSHSCKWYFCSTLYSVHLFTEMIFFHTPSVYWTVAGDNAICLFRAAHSRGRPAGREASVAAGLNVAAILFSIQNSCGSSYKLPVLNARRRSLTNSCEECH